MAAVSALRCTGVKLYSYGPSRAPGFYMVPRPDPYVLYGQSLMALLIRMLILSFTNTFILEGTVGNVAAFVLEPAQGWGGSIFPPEDFSSRN